MEMKAARVYIHDDTQGPWVLFCSEHIEADGLSGLRVVE